MVLVFKLVFYQITIRSKQIYEIIVFRQGFVVFQAFIVNLIIILRFKYNCGSTNYIITIF